MVVGLWVWHENCGGSHGIKVYEKERLRLKRDQREREDYVVDGGGNGVI